MDLTKVDTLQSYSYSSVKNVCDQKKKIDMNEYRMQKKCKNGQINFHTVHSSYHIRYEHGKVPQFKQIISTNEFTSLQTEHCQQTLRTHPLR